MCAAVIDLAEFAARRGVPFRRPPILESESRPTRVDYGDLLAEGKIDFCFWQGASGERYVHNVYSLIGCPQVPAGNFVLFARDADGVRTALHAGRVSSETPSLNLAEIRRLGATLGAAEVHVHLLARSEAERCVIEVDLRSGLGLEPDHQPLSA